MTNRNKVLEIRAVAWAADGELVGVELGVTEGLGLGVAEGEAVAEGLGLGVMEGETVGVVVGVQPGQCRGHSHGQPR